MAPRLDPPPWQAPFHAPELAPWLTVPSLVTTARMGLLTSLHAKCANVGHAKDHDDLLVSRWSPFQAYATHHDHTPLLPFFPT